MPRFVRVAVWVVGVLLAVGVFAWWLWPEDDGIDVVVERPIAFNLRYPPGYERLPAGDGDLLRLERRRDDGLFLDSFAVRQLDLPAYEGDVSAVLPVYADRELEALRGRFADFELVEEGKARVNEVVGYLLAFQAREGERRLYGRVVLLPEPVPGARRGVRLEMLATPSAGAGGATDVGVRGAIKMPYRSFRFGTEKP
jgi:hypothetical protein